MKNAKHKKKRNKRYQGEDAKQSAASSGPVVHHYQAVERSRLGQWWHDRKKVIKPISIVVAVIAFIIWLLTELFWAIF